MSDFVGEPLTQHARFPSWQQSCINAVNELDPQKFLERLTAAEKTVLLRVHEIEIEGSNTANDERVRINDALMLLRHLRGMSEWL